MTLVDLMTKTRLEVDARLRSRLVGHVTPVTYLLTLYLGRTAVIGWIWLLLRRIRAQLLIGRVLKEALQTEWTQSNHVLIFPDYFVFAVHDFQYFCIFR